MASRRESSQEKQPSWLGNILAVGLTAITAVVAVEAYPFDSEELSAVAVLGTLAVATALIDERSKDKS